jgi:diadenosine tetraphosphate (Ap4A) HIT family hydrolase
MDYLRLNIRQSRHWSWYVHENQCYLGGIVVVLNRISSGSLIDCTHEEWMALRNELSLYENFLSDLFSPDRFNYTQMGNEWEQLHVHAIPRYRSPRTWNGIVVSDMRWGQNPSPKPVPPLAETDVYIFSKFMMERLDNFLSEGDSRVKLQL